MVRIRHHIPEAKLTKPDAGEANIIYNAMRRKNMRNGMIATAREVCNTTRRLGHRSRLILRQWVQDYVRAVRAVRNRRVFLTETSFVANVIPSL
jgi:hypothetical protein